ncbi:Stk1 family PASTA domain-containing Ser/Thr kinase [Streptomyces sp. CRN 30]|uniref:Stk1 family PASTA domain-containing Ser/Thr kinase n=1 Tax=Streptomyces sp. CRN 30 TaxID=3075613 RepID=UPI002A81D4FC|nr:protein kinase [Streptomyces sp. CRN 30]
MSQDGAQGRYAGRALAGGRYQLRDLLGEGGMASVHLAYDSVLDRQVAVKTLHTELGREQAFRERFRREAQAVAKLTHANIVSVFDTGEDAPSDGGSVPTPYIVMEYVEGRPLGAVLTADVREHGAMPADKALQVTADVLAALEISHETGLVHRDIKPGNVMVTKRGVVKVMDFGIARAMQSGVTSMTQTGMVVGTPQYLSPEQALGRGVDARSDLYSVGIMLFQLVTGRLPFDADSPLAIAYAHVQEQPPAPSTINRALPPAVDALVARALRKNPNERFPSAQAMRDECLRVASSLHVAAPNIVPGAAPQSGTGVGSAVFPPVDRSAPGPSAGHMQTPYQPAPYGPSTPAPLANPAPAAAPTPTPFPAPGPGPAPYGYPQPGSHQQLPRAAAYAHGHGAPTPPPYTLDPRSAGPAGGSLGGGKVNRGVVIGAVVVSLVAVGSLITALALNRGDGPGGTDGVGGDASPSAVAGYKGPDPTRTIETTECTEPRESYLDPDKIKVPSFAFKNIDSVKKCLRAAGWTYKVVDTDENTWGDGTVMEQSPRSDTDADPEDLPEILLRVSTGNPPS